MSSPASAPDLTAPETPEEPARPRFERWRARVDAFGASRVPLVLWAVVVVAAAVALVLATHPVGPSWLGRAGAVAVVTAYAWALAARTGGRPVVFGVLALAIGLAAVLLDRDWLRTGAAVTTCVVASVLAVMVTVPAATYVKAVRETVIAFVVAGVGALATVGFDPVIGVSRFEHATFGLALVAVFAVVYRLGAGLHGLGRRGVAVVAVGVVLVVVTLAYAELLRRYGTPGLVSTLLDDVRWSRDHLGAFPRPIEAVLGVPALAYGVHMRARRRQGWWVCAFGVAGTSACANALASPAITHLEATLSVVYGVVVGLAVAFVVIRLDLALTGSPSRGRRARGRRSRRAEETADLRPEPRRTSPLW